MSARKRSDRRTLGHAVRRALAHGETTRARALCEACLAESPGSAEALRYLSQIEGAAGDTASAIRLGRQAVAAAPGDALAWQALGQAYAGTGEWSRAVASFREAVRLQATLADAWHNLGLALRRLGDPRGALEALKTAVRCDPGRADTWLSMARLLESAGQLDDALGCYERAARRDSALLPLLGDRQLARGEPRAALAAYDAAWSKGIAPARSGVGRGQALEVLGHRELARRSYRSVLEIAPTDPESLSVLVALADGDEVGPWREQAATLLEDPRTCDRDQALIGYGLARYEQQRCRVAAAAGAARRANAARRREAGAPAAGALAARVEAIESRYGQSFFAARRVSGDEAGVVPVWIVGMPRSGTTLAEQILSAHPSVHGAGELEDLPCLARRIAGPDETAMIEAAAGVTREERAALAEAYRAALTRQAAPDVRYAVDKTPFNLFHLAFAAVLFPHGRVIHCQRDPRDTALSIWLANFAPSQRYATDLTDIARMQRASERVMRHWRKVLPLPIHTLRYEAVVTNPEGEIARLLDFLGLPWEPACLRFHETGRAVHTPSRWQVRQPLYGSSVGAWRAYSEVLPELVEAFDDDPGPGKPGLDDPNRAEERLQ